MADYDFGGYATKNDMRCTDGRIIRRGSFTHQNKSRVPFVWQHQRNDIENYLGHADLEEREDGIYAYVKLNNSPKAQIARMLVQHGDLNSLSIFATNLMQKGADVLHGAIKEVSLVMAGANPGAVIDNVYMEHGDGSVSELDNEVVIYPYINLDVMEMEDSEMEHSDNNIMNTFKNLTAEQSRDILAILRGSSEFMEHKDSDKADAIENKKQTDSSKDKTIKEIYEAMTEEQRQCVQAMIGFALQMVENDEDEEEEDDDMEHYDEGEDSTMNVFENNFKDNTLQHDDATLTAVLNDAQELGSLKKSMLEHGITGIETLFPEARPVQSTPVIVSRDQGWVSKVMGGIKKSPFSRIKSIALNVTMDEARAQGYVKGKKKVEEQFSALKRVTLPQTVYKMQALDRDDILDITDFTVVDVMNTEMRMMLNEELARSALIGDGRSASAEGKINPQNIRPIYTDDEVYSIHYVVDMPTSGDITETSNAIIDAANFARSDYKGSGTPVFFADPKTISTLLMARDKIGNRMYRNMTDLAAAMRVSEVVEVPVMENMTRTDDDGNTRALHGIIVNLIDYTFGADKGGTATSFSDFDIQYNKERYLIETRCSGALTRPKSAIVLESIVPPASSGSGSN